MNLSGNHADIDKEVDLTDIRIFKQQYEANFRRLKYFGMQYIPDEEVVADPSRMYGSASGNVRRSFPTSSLSVPTCPSRSIMPS